VKGGEARLGESGREVRRLAPFYIDRTEVSNAAWARFCRATHRQPPARASVAFPVVNVSFDEAREFASWARKRLPTADEWEKAARGPNGQAFPWGNAFTPGAANLPVPGGAAGQPRDVAAHADSASPYGALNTLGNVWEWVDTVAPAPPEAELERYTRQLFHDLNPPLSRNEAWYQIRGGSFVNPPADQAARLVWDFVAFPARARQDDVGFRCAVDADKAAAVPRD